MTWIVRIHYADEPPTTATPYSETSIASISLLAGYGYVDWSVSSVSETPVTSGSKQNADGSLKPARIARYEYTLRTMPSHYSQRAERIYSPAFIAKKKHIWLELNTVGQNANRNVGDTDTYHSTDYVIPATLDDYSVESNFEFGTKTGVFYFKRKWRV